MRERPILFSSEMVRAILADHKTMTRRVVKSSHLKRITSIQNPIAVGDERPWWVVTHAFERSLVTESVRCPYGEPGDRLWVRETWADYFCGSKDPLLRTHPKWRNRLRYKVCCDLPWEEAWRPSIHMPRWASRLLLEVTAVRAERLHQITEDDARAEGVSTALNGKGILTNLQAFRMLWDKINAKRDYAWDSDPWVWVVTFRRIAESMVANAS